ncbi:MAG: TIGR02594 family protein [Hyphomicrobiales bacterium]|nr:MAG: TIGR02594 family protein [Hyphomicrobiales bacterium]
MFKWFEIAQNEQGVEEIKGQKHNVKIVQYFADVGHDEVKNDETAWCAAFVGSCLEKAGLASTRALNARSYLKWGRAIDTPVPGCIVVFKRGNSSWQGHVAFYIGQSHGRIKVLGGNQNNQVKVSAYSEDDLLGYRLPKTKMGSKTNWAAGVGSLAVLSSQAEMIGKVVDRLTEATKKGGDLADKIGSLSAAISLPAAGALLVVVGLFAFIIYERNKKVDMHGI